MFVFAVLGPQVANQLGWFTAEVGRQPWIVYGLMRTADAVSPSVTAGQVLASLVLFLLIYLAALHPVHLSAGSEDPARPAGRRPGRGVPPEVTMALDLNTIWFGLVGVLLTGYAILDGFDLGRGRAPPAHDRGTSIAA